MSGFEVPRLRKTASAVALFLVLLFPAATISFVHAETEFVAINADGSVSPSTAPVQRVGEVYTLTDDVGEIEVRRSGVILDGAGHTVAGTFAPAKVTLMLVENVTVKNLVTKGGYYGIYLSNSSSVTVSNNTVEGTSVPFPQNMGTGGIYVFGGGNNIIAGNRVENNYRGISLVGNIGQITVRENNITGNSKGMHLYEASNNVIYHNNFSNNSEAVNFDAAPFAAPLMPSLNGWDDGRSSGNYWSDYKGRDNNWDGIADTPYNIDSNNKDRYPLMQPWSSEKPMGNAFFSLVLVAAFALAIAIIAVLLFHFRKRKGQ